MFEPQYHIARFHCFKDLFNKLKIRGILSILGHMLPFAITSFMPWWHLRFAEGDIYLFFGLDLSVLAFLKYTYGRIGEGLCFTQLLDYPYSNLYALERLGETW